MAKVNLGILDGFSGKVGTVVGYSRYNRKWMRAYVDTIQNPRTGAQRLVRAKFRLLNAVGCGLLPAVQVGLAPAALKSHNTPANMFMRRNWERVTGASPEEVAVGYASLTLAEGHLPKPAFAQASFAESQKVSCTFTAHSGQPGATDNDLVYLYVYQAGSNSGVLSAPVSRSAGRASVDVPSEWIGLEVHVYGFAVGDGADNKGERSNSAYLGSGTIG